MIVQIATVEADDPDDEAHPPTAVERERWSPVTPCAVIDTFIVRPEVAERHADPERALRPGLWVVLAPEQTRGIEPPCAGKTAKVTDTGGNPFEVTIAAVFARSGVLAICFAGIDRAAIPRGSRVTWEGGP